jgi:hypothetical protein
MRELACCGTTGCGLPTPPPPGGLGEKLKGLWRRRRSIRLYLCTLRKVLKEFARENTFLIFAILVSGGGARLRSITDMEWTYCIYYCHIVEYLYRFVVYLIKRCGLGDSVQLDAVHGPVVS